jgi:hypothetical protein
MLEVGSFRLPEPLSKQSTIGAGILTDFRRISASLTAKISPFERYGQTHKIAPGADKRRSKRAVGGAGTLTRADLPASGRTSSAVARRKSDHAPLLLAPAALATWRSRQDVGEPLPRDCDFGYLEREVIAHG